MAKRSELQSDYSLEETVLEPEYVEMCCLIPAHVKVVGRVTNTEYDFLYSGYKVKVDKLDSVSLLERKMENSCCGGNGYPFFQIV